jgi:hypothetical protein
MYQMCSKLSEVWADKVPDAPVVKVLTIGKNEWFFDRPMALTPCAPRSKDSWRATGLQRKSLRVFKSPRKTFTKRKQV